MARVTGLRELRGGKVAVELDGARWRTVPAEVVVRAGLWVGVELDRPRLRDLARELRRARGFDAALRSVARREQSSAALRRRLERRGVVASVLDDAVGRLERVGLVDDERYAHRRAASLADRGHGDEAIRWRLAEEGIPDELAATAVGALEPELVRARRIAEARGYGPKTARELARRGFCATAVEDALGPAVADGA